MNEERIITMPFNIPAWNIEAATGYEPKTTFWQDFWIAIPFGEEAVKDTYSRAFNEWKTSHEYITEMALVLNHIGWALYNNPGTKNLSILFFELWEQLDGWCYENLEGEAKEYYNRVTD